MKIYYIFNLKDEITKLYQDKPASLYRILENIYYMHEEDVNYGFSIYKQLTNKHKVLELNSYIYNELHKDLIYSKMSNDHIINDIYHDEVSILKIKNSHIKLETNKSMSTFFQILTTINNNYFVCDFKNKDFFFLSEITNLVKN